MENKKIYVVGNGLNYISWLVPLGYVLTFNFEDADIVMFTGGEDVCPAFYKEPAGKYTSFNRSRDEKEQIVFTKALEASKPMLGICRGNQFISVMNGSKLIQHMNHTQAHYIETFDGKKIPITSTHHQMVYPYNLKEEDYRILAWGINQSPIYLNGKDEHIDMKNKKDVEIIYFPKTKCLGIQGHPEQMDKRSETVKYLQELASEFLN